MRAISRSSWGASKSNLLQVWATIRSVLDYGCEVIDLGCKQIADTYDKLQYQALKICCGGMKGTSASSLQVECGELPLDLRREKLTANHALRSIAIKNESVKTKYFISANTAFSDIFYTKGTELHWPRRRTIPSLPNNKPHFFKRRDARLKMLVGRGTTGMSSLTRKGMWRRSSMYVFVRCYTSSPLSTLSSPDFGGSSSAFPYLHGSLKNLLWAFVLS